MTLTAEINQDGHLAWHGAEWRATTRVVLAVEPIAPEAWDDIAADFQRLCNQYSHNITKTVDFQLIQ